MKKQGGRWVLDLDVRKYFDSIPFTELRSILAKRVTDGVVRRMIDKWLKAGVLDKGQLLYPKTGTPQGGVLSRQAVGVELDWQKVPSPSMANRTSQRHRASAMSVWSWR
ncbi:reverse transcriptase domain-containing protein [Cupriavidus pauculus]|uniref:reverse transcriptase domain-containing protein n=1 Tax=Cupriavidus pauculus TaxID=82633 RepID=UPI001D0C09C2